MAKPKVNKGEKISKDCIANAKKALNHFSEDELKDYVSAVNNRAREYEGIGRPDAINRAMQDINKQEMDILLSQAATKANDALKLEKKINKIKKGIKLPSFLHMTHENKDDNIQVARYKSRHQLFNSSLGKLTDDQYDLLVAGKHDKEIYAHLDGRKSDNPEINAIGEILNEYPEFRNLKMIQSNALQPHEIAADRKLKTIYNQSRVITAGQSAITQAKSSVKVNQQLSKEYFTKRRLETLDLKKTFGHTSAYDLEGNPNMTKIIEIINKSYDNIVRGVSQIFTKSAVVKDWEAVQRSRRLFYHAKDWESWGSFNEEFGTGSLFTAIIKDIEYSGNAIGIAEIMGSNPDAMYNAMRHSQEKAYPELPLRAYTYADGLYKNARGIDQTVYNPTLNNVKNALISLSTMNRLGKLPIQSIADVGQVAAFTKRFGYSYWSSYFDGIIHQFGLFPDEARIRLAKTLKMDLDVHMGYLGKFAEATSLGDIASKATTTFFKWTGMTALDNGNILSAGASLMKGLGHDAGKKFSELGEQTRLQFEKFNIMPEEWDALRSKVKDELFSVETVDDLSQEEIANLWEQSDKLTPLSNYRETLYNKVFGMFNMAKENTVLNPASFESMLTGGNFAPPGTTSGILLSLFRQFKQYPIAYFRRVWNGGMRDFDAFQSKLMYAFTLTAGTMMANSLSILLESIAEGKTPPDFFKMNANEKFKFLLRMAIPGAGIFFRVMDPRNENKYLVTNLLMSPSLDLISEGLGAGFALLNGDTKLAMKDVKNFVKHANPISTIPFADPFFESLMGDKPYLAPGQQPLY